MAEKISEFTASSATCAKPKKLYFDTRDKAI